ncbi:MAG: hypothetical protein ACKOW8_14980, partial [Flavobacteriales bacterium]
MKKVSFWLAVSSFLNLSLLSQSPIEYYKKHIHYLASDALEGRGVGSKGANNACGYIVGMLTSYDVSPGYQGAWLQSFEFVPKS